MRAVLETEHRNNLLEKHRIYRLWLFPLGVISLYGMLFIFSPGIVSAALRSSGTVLLKVLFPLPLVFILMLALDVFLAPAQIVKYIGKGTGIKGVFLSMLAGIISMGPVYAWFPLLKRLREKGADVTLIAIFLGNRAVKPVLLPVMISYLGWRYALVLTVLTCVGALAVGYMVGIFAQEDDRPLGIVP